MVDSNHTYDIIGMIYQEDLKGKKQGHKRCLGRTSNRGGESKRKAIWKN